MAIDVSITPAQEDLRALAQELADKEFRPRAARWDEHEEFPAECLEILAKQGLTGLSIPEGHGGLGLGDMEAVLVLEEIARACLNTAVVAQLFLNGPPRAIDVFGADAQRARWLPRIASGECLVGIGMTEPDAGSAALEMRARLKPDGDGYRLDAYKNMVTCGHKAGAYFVVTRFPAGEGERAFGVVMVERDAAGVGVSKVHKKMGLRGAAEAEISFDDVRVEPGDVLLPGAADGSSIKRIMAQFNHERLGNTAMCVGTAAGALDESIRYAQERAVGGTRLIDVQGIAWKLAEMATKTDAARLMMWRAAAGGTVIDGRHEPGPLDVAKAKWYANIVAQEVANEAIQIHGGYGFTREYPVERMFRDVRGLAMGAGTVEIQKNFIGRMLDRRGPRPRS